MQGNSRNKPSPSPRPSPQRGEGKGEGIAGFGRINVIYQRRNFHLRAEASAQAGVFLSSLKEITFSAGC